MVVRRTLAARLARSKTTDGGYGSVAGGMPEPEATALAAIALDDADARAWLEGVQRPDGSFGIDAGTVASDVTGLASLALPAGASLDRALDHLTSVSGANAVDDKGAPPYGWAWTIGAHGWTEPTAWSVLALRRGRPAAIERITDGLDVLRTQECEGGGWNYGTAESFGIAQPSFVQTTSIALFATRGADDALTSRGLGALARRWRREASGPLSLTVAAAAMRLLGHPDATPAASMIDPAISSTDGLDTVALAWAAIALGPALTTFEVG